MGDHQQRLEDLGAGRLATMDAHGIDISIIALWFTEVGSARPSTCATSVAKASFGRSSRPRAARPFTVTASPPQIPTVASIAGLAVGDAEKATRYTTVPLHGPPPGSVRVEA